MLEEKDLVLLRGLLADQKKEIMQDVEALLDSKVAEAEQRIAKNTVVLMDAEFSKRFDLLAEGQQEILDKLVPRSRVDDLEDEVKFLKSIVRQMNEDLQKLKKAQ